MSDQDTQTAQEWESGVGGDQCSYCGRTTVVHYESDPDDPMDLPIAAICRPCYVGEQAAQLALVELAKSLRAALSVPVVPEGPACNCERQPNGMVGKNSGNCPIHPLPGGPKCDETWIKAFHGDRCDSCRWSLVVPEGDLADAPTDVLVWLTDQPADEWWPPQVIADRVAPSDAAAALRSTFGALSTLYACGFVEGLNFEGVSRFRASDEGRKVVEEARRG